MTTGAKLPRSIDRHRPTLTVATDMTVDATRKTVISLTDAFVHGNIALMLDQLEMVAAHERCRCHTGVEFVRLCRTIDSTGMYRAEAKHQAHRQ